ncbi:MAG: mechanosensitive ion channel family protein [Myxococcota bacterium]
MDDETTQAVTETQQLIALVLEKLESWLTGFVEMVPNLIVAVLVLIATSLLARLGASLVRRAAQRTSTQEQVVGLLTVITRVGILALGAFVALGILQLEKTVTSLLAGVGVVGLALGFAFQDIASNLMSGVIMAIREPFQIGDLVQTHDQMGRVERLTLRATVLRNFSGQLVIIPNKDVLQKPILNYTQTGERRVEVPVGVSYDDDLERAIEAAREAVGSIPGRDESKDVDVIYTGFGDSSIDLSVRFWLDLEDDEADYLVARSKAVMAIHAAFAKADITIPFPIRTLDVPPAEAA